MSSARFFQVLRQAASEALLKDVSVLKPAVDILKAQKTTSIFAGTQLQQPNLFMAIGWDSAEDHESFKSSSSYTDFLAALNPALAPSAAKPDTHLVRFEKDPLVTFKAPFTEFLWLGLKDGARAEELIEAVHGVESVVNKGVEEGISVGGFAGKYVDSGDVLFFGGWTSPEVVSTYVHRPENWAIVSKVGPLASVDLTFSKLTSYKE